MPPLPQTELDVFPLCLGGNVFGWTVDETEAIAVLDAYAAAGGNFIDTADSYVAWVEGKHGGESETIIGKWMASRGNREQMIIATKVGRMPGRADLRKETISTAAGESLARLQTDYIDLYYAHGDDDPTIPIEETLGAFDELVQTGKARYIAASNYGAPRLAEALTVSRRNRLAAYVALQPHYNLVERGYEDDLAALCLAEGLACVPYFALANGFLTGKYRPNGKPVDSPRASGATAYLNPEGLAVLAALDEIGRERETSVAAVALAWLLDRPAVASVIASARTDQQLTELLPAVTLELAPDELQRLTNPQSS